MRLILLLALFCAPAWPALAGEVIGNTYISEKDGVIEISTDAWEFSDVEKAGAPQIVKLEHKASIDGLKPSVSVYRIGDMGGQIKAEHLLETMRKQMEKQGFEVGPMEPKRFGGKRVLTVSYVLVRGEIRADGVSYFLTGDKAVYWLSLSANSKIWDRARVAFDELMEKIKY